jgi:hypothetical protein
VIESPTTPKLCFGGMCERDSIIAALATPSLAPIPELTLKKLSRPSETRWTGLESDGLTSAYRG